MVAAPAPAMAAPSITGGFTSPEQLTYSLVSDSSHKGPATASSINLLFAPDSVLWLLATSSGGDLSYQGTWSYAGGKLTVRIDSGGFDRRGTFDPDFGLAEVVIPFQVFSGPPGTSTWDQHAADPVIGSYMVAEADAAATANGLSITSIIDDAASYVAGVSGATLGSGESTGVTPAAKAATSAITSRPVDRPRLQLGHFAGAAAAPGRSLGAALARTGRLAPQRNFDTGITKVDLSPTATRSSTAGLPSECCWRPSSPAPARLRTLPSGRLLRTRALTLCLTRRTTAWTTHQTKGQCSGSRSPWGRRTRGPGTGAR